MHSQIYTGLEGKCEDLQVIREERERNSAKRDESDTGSGYWLWMSGFE